MISWMKLSLIMQATWRMKMDKQVEEMCDSIDAAVFSGDSLHNREALERFRWYLGRWQRESVVIQESLDEEGL